MARGEILERISGYDVMAANCCNLWPMEYAGCPHGRRPGRLPRGFSLAGSTSDRILEVVEHNLGRVGLQRLGQLLAGH